MRLKRRCELFATTRSKWPFICFGFYRLWYLKHLFPDKQGVRYFDSCQCQWTQTEKNKAAAMEKPELWSIRKPTAGSNKHSKSFWTMQIAQRTSHVFTLSFCPHITKMWMKGYRSLWNNLSAVRIEVRSHFMPNSKNFSSYYMAETQEKVNHCHHDRNKRWWVFSFSWTQELGWIMSVVGNLLLALI